MWWGRATVGREVSLPENRVDVTRQAQPRQGTDMGAHVTGPQGLGTRKRVKIRSAGCEGPLSFVPGCLTHTKTGQEAV